VYLKTHFGILYLFIIYSIEEILASSDDSEVEDEGETTSKGRGNQKVGRKQKANKHDMYIKEDEDDIVDLISPTAASKLTGNYIR